MIATPYWSGLDISLTVQNEALILPIHIPLQHATDKACIVYYDCALRTATQPVKALILCNPTNPTGQCYPHETLQSLLDFCVSNNLHLISDEVYALSVHGGAVPDGRSASFTSALALNAEHNNLHVIYSLSKDFGCSGIRLVLGSFLSLTTQPSRSYISVLQGALVTQQHNLIRIATALSTNAQTSIFTNLLATHVLLTPSSYRTLLSTSTARLRVAYVTTTAFLQRLHVPYIPAVAGPFVFARLAQARIEKEKNDGPVDEAVKEREQMILQGLRKRKVCLVPGEACHMLESGWFRIAFGVSEEVLKEALGRIEQVLTSDVAYGDVSDSGSGRLLKWVSPDMAMCV